MAQIILDAGGWQNVIDFETGESLNSWSNSIVDDMKKIIPSLPYPGEYNPDSIEWTGDVGKALFDYNQPDFIFLSYATPDFIKAAVALTPEDCAQLNRRFFASVESFLSYTGYVPVIVGTGGMSDIREELVPPTLRGRLSHGNGLFPYAGIFRATAEELEQVRNIPHTKFFTKEDIRREFPQAGEDYLSEMPDILLLRESGYAFSRTGNRGMYYYKSPDVLDMLPIYTSLPMPSHITDVRRVIDEALDRGERVALIIADGLGADDFLISHKALPAKDGSIVYAHTATQYMTLLSGEHFYRQDMPLAREFRDFRDRSGRYPYSSFVDKDMPQNVLGRRKDKKTAAAGSRSMFTHAMSQADICIECHARQMVSSGILVLVNDPK